MEMTPRERWMALLNHQTPDRVPTDYQATEEVTARLQNDLGCADNEAMYRKLHIDARRFVEPKWRRPESLDPKADRWGVIYRSISYGEGSYLEPDFQPLAKAETVEDVHAYRWPSCDDFDYSVISETLKNDDGYRPIHSGCYEPFLLYGYLRGLQTAMEDLALRPEMVDAILGRIFDFHHEHHRRSFEAGGGRIDLTWVAEDLGSQTGPLMSLSMYRRYLMPKQIKMAELARSYGIHVMYHTDGAARLFLPDLIEKVGIEILNPVQYRCPGMEREKLVADFGDRLIFHGSIENQQVLPFGTVADVAREVRENAAVYRNARWICNPCHNLQPVSPTANIVAMYETIRECGKLS